MASNGKDALEMVEEYPPDIILLDIKMPVMDGIETLTKLRVKYKTLPVIMITAESDQLEHLQDMGISGFFPKTGDLTQLEQLLDPILRIQAKMKSKE
jgi:two-component system response regulator (stage 0 sporulation protein F)